MSDDADAQRDLVVIGASAGGVETLQRVVSNLPADLPAAVCIVLHIAPGSPSALASILRRAGPLPCQPAHDGESLRPGRILVAPPDHHLVIEDRQVRLTVGPRENGHRPAVDVLFRSAAAAGDGRVIGVILSGTRDDGAAGLAVIKANGGATIVQDPEEALYAGMPASALAHLVVDAVVPSERVAEEVVNMVNGKSSTGPSSRQSVGAPNNPENDPLEAEGVTTVCPECGGVLSERLEAGMTQWECRVGHRYSPESLADAQAEGLEAALWAAVRALEDRIALLQRMAQQAESRGQMRSARSFTRRADSAGGHAELVRDVLSSAATTTLTRLAAEDPAPEDEESVA
jgi:two-component system, chemotaxis family, protein-glutamate methylesterase/glutaminase